MKRYQLYLDRNSVAILDDFEKISNMSRSLVLRHIVNSSANVIANILAQLHKPTPKLTHFDKLIGAIDLKSKKQTNYALDNDHIYLQD